MKYSFWNYNYWLMNRLIFIIDKKQVVYTSTQENLKISQEILISASSKYQTNVITVSVGTPQAVIAL